MDNDNGSINTRVKKPGVLLNAWKKITPTFDPKTHPGSFQVETRLAGFQNLKVIRRLYGAALGKTAASHFDDIESGYITVLNAFRNVIVHKRGKVDKTFLKQVESFPEFSEMKNGDEIRLDGESVAKMRSAALLLGRELIKTADAELQRQK